MTASAQPSGRKMKLHTKILLGLVVGAIVGVAANLSLGPTHPLVQGINKYAAGPVGAIFLNLLFMIVVPLVFASIALGVAGLGDLRRVGRVGGKTMLYFVMTTVMSVTIGLILVQVIRPGSRITPEVRQELLATYSGDASTRLEVPEPTSFGIQTVVNIVTRNPVKSAVDLDLLGIIFFGLIFGAAITLIAQDRAKTMISFLEALNDIVLKIVEMAMKLAPYGVAGLIFGVTSRFGFALLKPLAVYVSLVIIALLIHVTISFSAIIRVLVGMSPIQFFSRVRAPIVTAFSTSSSSGTLPTSIATAEQNLGIPAKIAGFVLPLGATMNMNGTSLFEGITVIFLAQVFGITLSLPQQIIVVVMCVITAIGAAGVPGGSIPLLIGILAMFGVPAEGIGIILGVDRILDMSRTTVNVLGDIVGTAFIAKSEREWTPAMLPPAYIEAGGTALDESPGFPPAGEPVTSSD